MNVQSLREMMRDARRGFVPDHVGEALRHRYPRMVEDDAAELAEMIRTMIVAARDRLAQSGIEPVHEEGACPPKLSKREREYVTNIAALVTFQCDALTHACRHDDALTVGAEALAWCRTAGDRHQESIAWRAISSAHRALRQYDAQEQACRRALELAHASGVDSEIIGAIEFLAAFLVVQGRYDEAEEVNNEGLAILRRMPDAFDYYHIILMETARIDISRGNYVDGIRVLREALRWCNESTDPAEWATLIGFLGNVYLRLGEYRQCIECQYETIRLAEMGGSNVIRGWGYFRLAEARFRLKEVEAAEEMLDRAEECASAIIPSLLQAIVVKRTQIYAATDRLEDAVELCRGLVDDIEIAFPALQIFARKTMGDIAMKQGRYGEAEEHFRAALEVSRKEPSLLTPGLKVFLAQALHALERDTEVAELLDEVAGAKGISPEEEIRAYRLRASIAEKRCDLCGAIEHERRAFDIERTLLERRAEESLRNARIVAETDLLERETELERERRRRLEHELADAIVELGDWKRIATEVEERLHAALERAAGSHDERSAVKVLEETLHDLRRQARQQESPLKYLSGVDEEFFKRLRERCPDLTAKQERLCGLLRAGLASNEIANVLGLEAEGLKAQRKRLRKRLGLAPEERLETMLAEI